MDTPIRMTPGQMLLIKRAATGLSQREVGEATGIHQSEISKLERAAKKPSANQLKRLKTFYQDYEKQGKEALTPAPKEAQRPVPKQAALPLLPVQREELLPRLRSLHRLAGVVQDMIQDLINEELFDEAHTVRPVTGHAAAAGQDCCAGGQHGDAGKDHCGAERPRSNGGHPGTAGSHVGDVAVLHYR